MIILKVNLSTTSKRAQEILANPRFKNADLSSEFGVTLDRSDKILTVFHNGKSGEIELIFNDVLAIFAKNRSILDLWKINFREVENFLRDENHLPAFGDMTTEMEEILNLQKIGLVAETLKTGASEEIKTLTEMLFDWEKLSLVAKNEWARDFLKILGSELIFCDGTTMTFTKFPKDVGNMDLEIMVGKIFEGGELILPMKVVAV